MGLLSTAGSFSRAIGPLVIGWIYTDYGTYWTMGWGLIFSGIGVGLLFINYKRLVPFNNHNKQASDSNVEIEVTKL